MSQYTRKELLERFSRIGKKAGVINEDTLTLPCFLEIPTEPEGEDSHVDFEAIRQYQKDEQDKKKAKKEMAQKQKPIAKPYVSLLIGV